MKVPTTCPMDCPDTCALEVEVDDGAVVTIGGAADHPTTRGFICSKVARYHRRLDHPDRLLHPLRRTGAKGEGRFERISWEEAIGTITERFHEIRERWGGEAILPYHYGGSNGLLSDGFVDDLYFARLGASRLAKTLCAAPSGAVANGMYGKMPGVAHEDFPAARTIVVWGANPKTSQIHLVPFLQQARQNRAFVAVVDPQRHFSEREVNLHLAVRPGTDLPVALAMIERWRQEGRFDHDFLAAHADSLEPLLARAAEWSVERAADEAGVEATDVARLADAYADAQPALLRTGWGLERNVNGGQAMAALLAMPALLGKFAVRGGGYTMSNSGATRLDLSAVLGDFEWTTRVVNMTELGKRLAPGEGTGDRGIRGLFIYNVNPLATVPDQNAVRRGLAREDLFTVVFEQVMTDTAPWADIVLPAATFLEQWEIKKSYGSYVLGGIRPAIERCGEAMPNVEVFAALGRAMGFADEPFTWDEKTAFDRVAAHLRLAGEPVDASRLEAGLWVRPHFGSGGNGGSPNDAGPTPIQFATVHPSTADGKIHLTPPCLGQEPFAYHPVTEPGFPLALISPGSHRMITSTLGEFNFDRLTVTLNPDDATARRLTNGGTVRVWNERGEVVCPLVVSDSVRPGVAVMPKGAWLRSSVNGATSTALAPPTVQRVAGGACFNDARVEVTRYAADTAP
jgi:anaerobic selenocysteine-containing dehydrogenase